MADPAIPLAIPPPVSPGGFGIWVKKSRLIEPAPILTILKKTRISGVSTRSVAIPISSIIPTFFIDLIRIPFTCGLRHPVDSSHSR